MNRRRLERLQVVMQRVADENRRLDMSDWIGYYLLADPSEPVDLDESGEEACGTACCAAGYAALDSLLQEEGLHMIDAGTGLPIFSLQDFAAAHRKLEFGGIDICFEGRTNFNALAHFFDISRDQAEHLFDPDFYDYPEHTTPADVIARAQDAIRTS